MQFVNRGLYLPQRYSDRNGAAERGNVSGAFAVGVNQVLVAAIPGKCIFVPSLIAYGGGANSYSNLKTVSGVKLRLRLLTDATNPPNLILPFNESGWIDTLPGEALLLDQIDSACALSFNWYAYTP